jgi:myo-inositol-1(or 4)-monophosphatase
MSRLPQELAIGTLRLVRDLAVETGARMVALGESLREADAKGGGHDVVTKADAFSEAALTSALARHFPEHRIAGEEGTRLGPADSPWTWHVDPLDGTGNYARRLPYWAISIGLAYEHQPVLGVIHGPVCRLTVYGAVGLGAWSGEQPMAHASPAGPTKEWMVATDWPWDLAERQRTADLLRLLAPRIRQYKTFGSAAIDLAHLALGHIDAYAISKIFPWDQAGGAAIARALGYDLRRWSGEPWDLRHGDIVACRPGMAELADALRSC